jgi:hypothetical protein
MRSILFQWIYAGQFTNFYHYLIICVCDKCYCPFGILAGEFDFKAEDLLVPSRHLKRMRNRYTNMFNTVFHLADFI